MQKLQKAELMDIQKELEGKVKELSGSIDDKAENDKSNSRAIPLFVRESAATDSKAENDEPN